MAGAAVAYAFEAVVGESIATAASFAALDAGILVGSEYAFGTLVAGAVGLASNLAATSIFSALSGGGGDGGGGAIQSVSSARAQGVLLNVASNVSPVPVVYGTRRVGGSRVFCEASGPNNEYLNLVVALAEGEVDGYSAIYIDDVNYLDPRFYGTIETLGFISGTDTQPANALLMAEMPGRWTSDFRGAGIAYIYARLKYAQGVYGGLPVITVDMRGKKIYDPRTGLTAFSNNPALCIRDYLTSTRYGRGIDPALIDDAAIIVAANHCDELVTVPTGTQARYTCDGVIDVNSTCLDNIKSLLTCCRGTLVYSAGIFRLVIDKLTTPGFAFTEDNITGDWTITQPGRRAKFNRVTTGIFNSQANWQPDFAIAESTAYRTLDNNLLLEAKIDTPFTSDIYRGQQLAGLYLKQSRFGLSVRFKALQEGLRAEVGDVVTITHSTPGWVLKPFRVVQLDINNEDEVEVTCIEYDDSVYTLDTLTLVTGGSETDLPDVFTVDAPGAPTVTESLYQTSGSAGVRSRATIAWAAVPNAFVNGYLLEYQKSSDLVWQQQAKVSSLFDTLDDLAPGIYNFRLRAENAIDTLSAYSPTTSREILGLTAPPATITGLTVIASAGRALASWDLSPDLDVRIGGRIIVRHTPLTSGAVWENGIVLGDLNGDAVGATLDLITGTYMVKAEDSSGNYSNAMVSFVATESQVTGYTTVATLTQAPTFAGAKTGTYVDASALRIAGNSLIDSMGLIDSWGYIDSLGGVAASGSYAFDAGFNFGSVQVRHLKALLQTLNYDSGDLIDDRGLVDDWGAVDGGVINDVDITLYYRTTQTDPTGSPVWGPWTPFMVADVTAWGVQIMLVAASGSPTHNTAITTLTVVAQSSP